MLDSFKRLISRNHGPSSWLPVQHWAHDEKMVFSGSEDATGFWIEGGLESRPWRLEWGSPQRQYIKGAELRIRIDMGVAAELQMLLLSKKLFDSLEHNAFESFTETTQTLIDTNLPEELRWLVMFPTANYQAVKAVRSRLHLLGSSPLEAAHWIEGVLAKQLELALSTFLIQDIPFLIMVLGSRVYLRMQLETPLLDSIQQALAVFETAVLQAIQTASLAQQNDTTWQQSTTATAWQTRPGEHDPAGTGS
jgi:hypothetical protein